MECLALPSIEGVVDMKKVELIVEDSSCVVYVSGEVSNLSDIASWSGGFYVPVVGDQIPTYTIMTSVPVGNDDGDIIVIFSDNATYPEMYDDQIREKLSKWGVSYD